MKKLLVILVVLLIVAGILFFGWKCLSHDILKAEEQTNETIQEEDDSQLCWEGNNVKIEFEEGSLSKNGVTVIITDTSEKRRTYTKIFRIDKKINDTWVENDIIEGSNYVFHDVAYLVEPETQQLKLKFDWSQLYGELEAGEYCFVMKLENEDCSIEFHIN